MKKKKKKVIFCVTKKQSAFKGITKGFGWNLGAQIQSCSFESFRGIDTFI